MTFPAELRQIAEMWRSDDPDPVTVAEIVRLLESKDEAALANRFRTSLEFGTAGLRGLLGAGPNRMNRKVVLQTTAGLCAYLAKHVENAKTRGLAIGFDGRRMSRTFADDVASVAAGMGFRVHTFDDVVPTPLLAFTCRHLRAAGAVMVTASHNPPEYNGYKVFWENGAQIIPPHDGGIAEAIARVGKIEGIVRTSLGDAEDRGLYDIVPAAVERAYLDGVRALQVHPGKPRDLGIAYTAMHGVGDRLARTALAEAGFHRVASVPEQAEPDGEFPTVRFPNPEEPGAMDLVLALAAKERADLVLANDPDADRLAVAVRDASGNYVQLSGNEVGCLLGHYLLDQGPAGDGRLVVNTIVSSPMLGAIARAHGAQWSQTLTGFKWIANLAMKLEAEEDARFVFGYEEALGYTVGRHVRDKDGVSTAVVMADLAAFCKSHGRTLLDELEVAWRRYGMYSSTQVSRVHPGADGAARIASIMASMRDAAPRTIGGHDVVAVTDLLRGERVEADGTIVKSDLPPSDVLTFDLRGDHRVMLRPSGTEPKIKIYFDVRVAIAEGENVGTARARGDALLKQLVDDLVARID